MLFSLSTLSDTPGLSRRKLTHNADGHSGYTFRPVGWSASENTNCGWDMNVDVATNNLGKYICPDCTNSHYGANVDSISECVTICDDNATECAGFTFWETGTLGACHTNPIECGCCATGV